jgi:phosphoenolpyruvate carboxylase
MVLFETFPRLFAELEESLRSVYGSDIQVPEVLSFGSWIGGDRDGNPFVTADSTRAAVTMARHVIVDHYIAETTRLIGQLSMSTRRIGVSKRSLQRAGNTKKNLAKNIRAGSRSPPPNFTATFSNI